MERLISSLWVALLLFLFVFLPRKQRGNKKKVSKKGFVFVCFSSVKNGIGSSKKGINVRNGRNKAQKNTDRERSRGHTWVTLVFFFFFLLSFFLSFYFLHL